MFLTAFLFAGTISYSQSNQATNTISLGMPEVQLLKSTTPAINLTLSPGEAGLAVEQSKSDESTRLLISSVISEGKAKHLSAAVTTGSIPPGTFLRLVVLDPSDSFVGTPGAFAVEVELGATAKNIIENIGTCYSGTGADDGYKLKYTFGVITAQGSYELIRASTGTEVTVTLTLASAA